VPTDIRAQPYRPLVSGIRIFNEITGSPGTLGCIALDTDDTPYIVSCYHVLGRSHSSTDVVANDEPIFQSTLALGGGIIARTRTDMMNAALDYGAAIIVPAIAVSTSLLELDPIQQTATPEVGMRVIKSGAQTGVTLGIVTDVTATLITIESLHDAPIDYVLSEKGDSGAIWLDVDTGNAVGLHFSGKDNRIAYARPLGSMLDALGLRLLE